MRWVATGERATEAKHVNGLGRAEDLDGVGELLLLHAILQALERDHAFGREALQNRLRIVGALKAPVAP